MLTFAAKATAATATRVDVETRQFTLVIDEPPALGGVDDGPNPVEYVLAALAGCMNVVVHLVAKERQVVINSMTLTVEGDLDPSKCLGKDVETRAGFQAVRLNIDIDADATPEEIDTIIAIAKSRCPVGDNLASPTPVTVTRSA